MRRKWMLWALVACSACFASVPLMQKERPVIVELPEQVAVKASVVEHVRDLVQDNTAVMKQLHSFFQEVQQGVEIGTLSQEDADHIYQATLFAAQRHKDHMRKNAEHTPYIVHPLGVAEQIMRIGHAYDADVLIAALLHDVIENTNTTYAEIESVFGKDVTHYVKEMTEDQNLPIKMRKKLQIIHAFHQSAGATLIKLSDKLHNLHTLVTDPPMGWSQDKMDQYFQWAQAVVDNLPEANVSLKDAVHHEIAAYWEMQAKS